MSEFTLGKLKGTYRSREVDLVIVQGKTEPVAVYEMLDFHSEESFPRIADCMALFKDGLTAYRARKWDSAQGLFGKVLELNPNDKPSKIYIERAEN